MIRRVWPAALLAALLTSSTANAQPPAAGRPEVPKCAGEMEIAKAHIMRVEHDGVLVLTDGRALSLEGIRLPFAAQDHAPQTFTDQAYAALNALAKGQVLNAHAVWPKEDRYDRVRSQVFDLQGNWLQIELLQQGLARVSIPPDRGECASELFDAEAKARAAHLGLWSSPAYAVRTPDTVKADVGTFQIVQGTVQDVAVKDGRTYLNFGPDWKTDFTVVISPDDMKTFRRMGVNPRGYKGKTVRVRGIVQQLNGPEIDLGNPKQVEVLP